ncbi:MAG: hypothetical protein Q8Q73_08000 [Stagnimonas sp.]|nr:hypothetical protein [Stagnimonas sp.]
MTPTQKLTRHLPLALTAVAALLLAGCGGGGSGVDGALTATTPSAQGTVSGSAVKGPVSGATVQAFALTGGVMGAQISSAVTDANGAFTMPMGSYAGPLMLQVSGGTYTDEATGAPMTMASGDVMTAALPSVASGASVSGIQVTPVTSMAQTRALQMPGGMTDANIAAANAAMGNYFSVSDILRVAPMNPLVPGSGATASPDARNYGMTLAAISQYALSIGRIRQAFVGDLEGAGGMINTSALVTAMMSDASDGMMDGKMGAGSISMPMNGMPGTSAMAPSAGSSGLATGMTNFVIAPTNKSGLTATDVAPLVQKMFGSSGKI